MASIAKQLLSIAAQKITPFICNAAAQSSFCAARTTIILKAVVLLMFRGIATHITLSRHLGREWVRTNFAELNFASLLRTASQLVRLLWKEGDRHEHTAQSVARLAGVQRRLLLLSDRFGGPQSEPARRLLQAAFARSAAAIIGHPVSPDLMSSLRVDRSLRDLLTTWIDLIRNTTGQTTPDSLQSSLAVHAAMVLPAGSRLPKAVSQAMRGLKTELSRDLKRQKHELRNQRLLRAVSLSSLQVLAVPMAYARALVLTGRTDGRHSSSIPKRPGSAGRTAE